MTDRVQSRLLGPIGLLVGLLLCEVVAWPLIGLMERRTRFSFTPIAERFAGQSEWLERILAKTDTHTQLDPEIGWIYRAGHDEGPYTSNAQGVRGQRVYSPVPAPGTIRVAAFGGSVVHANEVADDEAWCARAEQLNARIECLNYGVGAYGTDQSLLLYRRHGQDLAPSVVILGVDTLSFARNVNRYRRFRSSTTAPLFKPRFLLGADGDLELLPNPFPREADLRRVIDAPHLALAAGEYDHFFNRLEWNNPVYDYSAVVRLVSTLGPRFWSTRLSAERLYSGGAINPDSSAFRLFTALIRAFAAEVEAAGQSFLLVVFPTRQADVWGDGRRAYAPLLAALPDHPVLDVADVLAADARLDPQNVGLGADHLSVLANDSIGRAVAATLESRFGAALASDEGASAQ